jgi:hypothetical protein
MKVNRRDFTLGSIGLGASFLSSCSLDHIYKSKPKLSIYGPESDRGHFLRDFQANLYPIQKVEKKEQVIILGGGASGLSALHYLKQNGLQDVLLLELGREIGGNARSGSHDYGSYPWGAHYLPIPSKDNVELVSFLNKAGAISDFDNLGRPLYKEDFLVHAPEERLFRYGAFQNGLFPDFNVPKGTQDQKEKFYQLLESYKHIKTDDGKKPFSIPISISSRDERLLKLDRISGLEFLKQNGINDPRVLWYADYATRDDYGTSLSKVSAWGLLHYFLARDSFKANQTDQDILTWPEGNNWLIRQLVSGNESFIQRDEIVLSVVREEKIFKIRSYSIGDQKVLEREALSIVCALPSFIARRIMSDELIKILPKVAKCNPWVVSNIILKSDKAYEMPWDSVNYHSASLGFVRANHQDLYKKDFGSILTHYNAYSESDPVNKRQELFNSSLEELAKPALEDLTSMYPVLNKEVLEVRMWIWAHAMREVGVGSMEEAILGKSALGSNGLFYAHTDASSISIFEEAFYQGYQACESVIKYLRNVL